MALRAEQKQEFKSRGIVMLRGAVPEPIRLEALRTINISLGQNGIDPALLPKFRAQSYCPDVQGSEAIRGLYEQTPAREVMDSLVGDGQLRPVTGGQIAIRFPVPGPPAVPRPHIDGMHTPTNGVPEGQITSFTALVAVFLTDVTVPNMGNFTVWPGSHLLNQDYFKREGPQSLLNGMPKVDLPDGEQVIARAGDIAIAHYLLSHAVGPNVSPFPRYAVFFRLKHVDHESRKWDTLTDAWLEWPGMRA
jgi:hypothetical protein